MSQSPTTPARILLVEDELKLGKLIADELRSHDYDIRWAANANEAHDIFEAGNIDLAILDVNLPDGSGLNLCREFRQLSPELPILMLTALGAIEDKMEAFELGADDYLVKPFHFNELLARMKVFLRRKAQPESEDQVLAVADLILNPASKVVTRGGQILPLTAKEFTLLELLMRSRGRVISKAEIAEKVWGINFETGTNTIEVYINFLRNKIDKPFDEKLIHTRTGFGYFIQGGSK